MLSVIGTLKGMIGFDFGNKGVGIIARADTCSNVEVDMYTSSQESCNAQFTPPLV